MARENVRTTRDVLPRFAWELMNELHLLVDTHARKSVARGTRREFLDRVIGMNQQFNGLLDTTVTRDHTLWFIRLGQFIERCDMSSRIVDVAATSISERTGGSISAAPLLSANLLQSLSATAAFRRRTGPIIVPEEVIDFIFESPTFPRSLTHCINAIEETTSQLKAPGGMLRQIRAMAKKIQRIDTTSQGRDRLHALIDEFQADLGDLHEAVSEHWFLKS
ncbi:MAG TPA: alpha-E domain-containing protein, partial [Gammaproteobacteria bacterium]|nr:alpha-E domain-containing protein [Gammaproteobacteria bacterium]